MNQNTDRAALAADVVRCAEMMEMAHTARGIPTSALYRGIAEGNWQRSRKAFREAVDRLAALAAAPAPAEPTWSIVTQGAIDVNPGAHVEHVSDAVALVTLDLRSKYADVLATSESKVFLCASDSTLKLNLSHPKDTATVVEFPGWKLHMVDVGRYSLRVVLVRDAALSPPAQQPVDSGATSRCDGGVTDRECPRAQAARHEGFMEGNKAAQQPAQPAEPPHPRCDSPAICAHTRQCAGQYGTKMQCAELPFAHPVPQQATAEQSSAVQAAQQVDGAVPDVEDVVRDLAALRDHWRRCGWLAASDAVESARKSLGPHRGIEYADGEDPTAPVAQQVAAEPARVLGAMSEALRDAFNSREVHEAAMNYRMAEAAFGNLPQVAYEALRDAIEARLTQPKGRV